MAGPSDPVFALLNPTRLTAVVDIGANPIDGEPPYLPLLAQRACRVIGFEPQPDALAALNARKSDLETYLPDVVGDGAQAKLYVCHAPGMTSVLRPDPRMLNQFDRFMEFGRVLREIVVPTRRLDDIAEIGELDFLKLDVQGSELAIFRNGRARLASAVAVQTEVSFVPLYEGQPVFGEVDLELRASGFIPHALTDVKRWMIQPVASDATNPALNQLLEADIVYVRDFTRPELMSSEQLKHLALIAHYCYRSYDLAANCIHHLAARSAVPPDAMTRYLAGMTNRRPL
jgi:FkbM family methyltransferase